MVKPIDRAWEEISQKTLEQNLLTIRDKICDNSMVMGVLKADAYGHGAKEVAKVLAKQNIDWLGTATIVEGFEIREVVKDIPLLIFGALPLDDVLEAAEKKVTISGISLDYLEKIETFMRDKKSQHPIDIHLKIDTGLNRTGLTCREDNIDEVINNIKRIKQMKYIRITGIFTHFACPTHETKRNEEITNMQANRFFALLDELDKQEIDVGIKHCCGSLAAVYYPEYQLDLIRAGVIIYGVMGSNFDNSEFQLKQAMSLKSRVIHVHEMKKGEFMSYNALFEAQEDTKVALLSIGYADGYRQVLTNRSKVLINDEYYPTVGRICMDYVMVNLGSESTVSVGDEVTLIGYDQKNFIPVSYIADLCNEIEAEVTCNINKRVPRIMI